jgi:hypothetical protein
VVFKGKGFDEALLRTVDLALTGADYNTTNEKLAALVIETKLLHYTGTPGASGTIDPDGDFDDAAADYEYDMVKPAYVLLRTIRGLERAVAWVVPGGEFHCEKYDSLPETGIRASETSSYWFVYPGKDGTWIVDTKPTRQAVTTTVAAAETRTVYTGNAALELSTGERYLPDHDDTTVSTDDATEATTLATNLFGIFSTATRFINCIVQREGYLQPGNTVDFSYSRAATSIARGDYLICGIVYDVLRDYYESLVLTNNIVLPREASAGELDINSRDAE